MASIYEIASIQAGDPQARARTRAGKASASLNQYKHQKEIIADINAAYKAAEGKTKKNKFGWGLGGSLLGGLLGMSMGPLGAALMAAGSTGLAEHVRQKTYDPTEELRAARDKYKGRRAGEGLEEDVESIEDQLDSGLLQDMMISGISSFMMPTGENKMFSDFDLKIPLAGSLSKLGVDTIEDTLTQSMIDSGWGQAALGLGRYAGAPLLQDLMTDPYQGKRMAPSPFRNPYGGF